MTTTTPTTTETETETTKTPCHVCGSVLHQGREHPVRCWCGTLTWEYHGRCPAHAA